jgi:CRISPR-associated protein Cas1
MNEETLIPVRALNQVSYCERLYYFMYVDRVMPTNEHVEAGKFDHRRVDDDRLADKSRKEGNVTRTRGVSLTSETLGITGVLDILEQRGDDRYPVETKHGSAPRDDDGQPTVWPNDAIQLCAQGLLLEETQQRPVTHGIQFHVGTRERVEVPFTPELREQTRAAIARCRELDALDAPPPPLPGELRHRCFGCSLAGVCLPEETLYQIGLPKQGDAEGPPTALTRVIPDSDDGAVLYLQEPGSSVGKRSEHLVVKKDGQELSRIPMHTLRQVVVFGNVQVSTQALETLVANDIFVAYLTGHGRFIGTFAPSMPKNVGLREAQYRVFGDPERRLELTRAVVRAKIANQRTLLMRSLRGKSEGEGDRGSDEPAAREMAELLRRLDGAVSVESLLGTEGQAAALYFGQFGRFLKREQGFDFTTRNRRPPRDPVNALLSFAYALLAKDCFAAVSTVGFDPYKGFFHGDRHGKPSLALDLMEEFRPVIADSVVLTLINNALVTPSDFLTANGGCLLTDGGREAFFRAYEQRKATVVTHPLYGYKMSYGRMLEVQARMLAAHVRGNVPGYSGFVVR